MIKIKIFNQLKLRKIKIFNQLKLINIYKNLLVGLLLAIITIETVTSADADKDTKVDKAIKENINKHYSDNIEIEANPILKGDLLANSENGLNGFGIGYGGPDYKYVSELWTKGPISKVQGKIIIDNEFWNKKPISKAQRRIIIDDEFWNKIFGEKNSVEIADSVQQNKDKGYIILGGTTISSPYQYWQWLVKTDINGNEIWNKVIKDINIYQIQQTEDGGYILAGENGTYSDGYNYDANLIKTDINGGELWRKSFGKNNSYESARSVRQTTDGGYILAGGKNIYRNGKIWLIKTDSTGKEMWNKTCDYSIRK